MNSRLVLGRRRIAWRLRLLLVLTVMFFLMSSSGLLVATQTASATAGVTTYTGTIDGSKYLIEVPANWNHTLVLYSHGYEVPGSPIVAKDAGDPITGAYLLSQGYALAGSSFRSQGWALEDAFKDQSNVLDRFDDLVGTPDRTIAWGHSLGGIITAGLVQKFPNRFVGALPMCGVLSGGVGTWNVALDSAFVFKTLLVPSTVNLQLVNINNPSNLNTAEAFLANAMSTPQGRARVAMVAAMGDTPGWINPFGPEPAATDYASRLQSQFLWFQNVTFPFAFALRAELEARAGGNPSWNTGVNYSRQLDRSINKAEVQALYAAAGLDLNTDLKALADAPRVAAKESASDYLVDNIAFTGALNIPVLTIHTTGDGLVPVENEQAYAKAVSDAGYDHLLRQAFIHRAGHCTFTPAETITAFNTLVKRIDTGKWSGTPNPTQLNAQAAALGPGFNIQFGPNSSLVPTAPAYFAYKPARFLRPFTFEFASNDD